nr:hypothetical protein [Pseudoxanthomonas sp. LH2527]
MRRKILLGIVVGLLALVAWLHYTGSAATHGITTQDMDWNGDGAVTQGEIAQAIFTVVVEQKQDGNRQCNTFAWRNGSGTLRMDCKTVFQADPPAAE